MFKSGRQLKFAWCLPLLFIPHLAQAIELQVPLGQHDTVSDLSEYISLWYVIIISLAGVLAACLIVWAGFQWLFAAGNVAKIKEAKNIIVSAISGLLIAFLSYSILYLINPNLVKMEMPELPKISSIAETPVTQIKEPTNVTCPSSLPASNPCSQAYIESVLNNHPSIKQTCSSINTSYLSKICQKESSGISNLQSSTDHCTDGTSFSYGLFQINVAANGSLVSSILNDSSCSSLIIPDDTSGPHGKCLRWTTTSNGSRYCSLWNCHKKSSASLTQCKQLLYNAENNILMACSLYGKSGGNYQQLWPYSVSQLKKCGLNPPQN